MVGAVVGVLVGVDVLGADVGVLLIWQHVQGQSARTPTLGGPAHEEALALVGGHSSCSIRSIAQHPLTLVGTAVGNRDGKPVGKAEGVAEGPVVGTLLGVTVGLTVGDTVGNVVGLSVGPTVGLAVGEKVGDTVGAADPHTISSRPQIRSASMPLMMPAVPSQSVKLRLGPASTAWPTSVPSIASHVRYASTGPSLPALSKWICLFNSAMRP